LQLLSCDTAKNADSLQSMQIQQLAQSIVSLCNALGVSVNDVVAEMSASSSGAEAPELRHSAEVVEVPAEAREIEAFQILMRIARSQRHMITIGRGHRLNDWDITVYRDGRAQAARVPFNGSFLDAMHHVRAKMQSEHMDDGIDWARSGKDEY